LEHGCQLRETAIRRFEKVREEMERAEGTVISHSLFMRTRALIVAGHDPVWVASFDCESGFVAKLDSRSEAWETSFVDRFRQEAT
jgi:hypothetical protein